MVITASMSCAVSHLGCLLSTTPRLLAWRQLRHQNVHHNEMGMVFPFGVTSDPTNRVSSLIPGAAHMTREQHGFTVSQVAPAFMVTAKAVLALPPKRSAGNQCRYAAHVFSTAQALRYHVCGAVLKEHQRKTTHFARTSFWRQTHVPEFASGFAQPALPQFHAELEPACVAPSTDQRNVPTNLLGSSPQIRSFPEKKTRVHRL